jgi:hypothetical protein
VQQIIALVGAPKQRDRKRESERYQYRQLSFIGMID